MHLIRIGAAALMFGVSAFIFSTGWHVGVNANWAGQTCYSYMCLRSEWIGLGAAGVLVSAIILALNLRVVWQSSRPGEPAPGPATRALRIPRINVTSLAIIGLATATAFAVAATNYGIRVSGSTSRPGECAAETPVEISLHNNTLQALSAVEVGVAIVPLSGAIPTRESVLRVTGPIAPLSAGIYCFSTELEAPPLDAAPASDGSMQAELNAALDRVDEAIKFGRTNRVEVRLLRTE